MVSKPDARDIAVPEGSQLAQAQRWAGRALLAAVLAWCAIPLSPNTVDSDFWGHVQYGQDVLAHGLPATATYTYTAEGYRWINHENLSELSLGMGVQLVGTRGLLVLKCALGLLVLGLIVLRARSHHVGLGTISVVCVLVSVNLSTYWSLRPQLFSFVLLALLVALLDVCFDRWPWGWRRGDASAQPPRLGPGQVELRAGLLWLALPLLAVWANTHGGFAAGLCIFAAYLAIRGAESIYWHGWRGAPLAARLGLWIAGGVAVTLLNPYGPELHLWMRRALGIPRPEIREWHPLPLWSGAAIGFWLLVLTAAGALAASRRRLDIAQLALLSLTAWQTLSHQRHLPLLAILIGLWIPPHLDAALAGVRDRWRAIWDELPGRVTLSRAAAAALAAWGLVCAASVAVRLSGMHVPRDRYPVSALEFLAQHQLEGKALVSARWAQYTLATVGARSPLDAGLRMHFDGRFRTCYPQLILDMHFDFLRGPGGPESRYRSPTSPPVDPGLALRFRQPDLVLIDRGEPHAVAVMGRHQGEWCLLYQDAVAQLWGRRTRYDRPESPHYLAAHVRQVSDQPQRGSVPWPAAPGTGSFLGQGPPHSVGRRPRNVPVPLASCPLGFQRPRSGNLRRCSTISYRNHSSAAGR